MDFRTDRQTEISDTATDSRGFRPRFLFYVLLLLLIHAAASTAEGARITVIITDTGGEARLPARCCVIDSLGQSLYPYIYTSLYHTFGDGYFYSNGEFVLMVPEGPTVVRIAKGPEYRPFIDTLTVHADTTVTVVMERIADMRHAGWFSGDTHVHIDHQGGLFTLDPSDAHFMGMAEDLQFVNCLDNEFHFIGSPDPVSTEIRFEEALSDLGESETKMSPAASEVVEIRIFDVSGRLVRRLRTGSTSQAGGTGQRSTVWDGKTDTGREAASGIYFCRVRRGAVETSAKMLLVR